MFYFILPFLNQAYRNWVKRSRQGIEEQKLPGLDYTPNQLFFLNEAQVRSFFHEEKYIFIYN
jgi:hypothetical protein